MDDPDALRLLGLLAFRGGPTDCTGASDAAPDPRALISVALAYRDDELLTRVAADATATVVRQAAAIAAAHLRGDQDLVAALARDHLADHPDDDLVRWIADQTARPTPDHGNTLSTKEPR